MKPPRLRVCFLTPEFPPFRIGGIGAYVAALAAGIGECGHTVDVVGCDIHPHTRMLKHKWGRSWSVKPERMLNGSVARVLANGVRVLAAHRLPGAWRLHAVGSARRELAAAVALQRFVRVNAQKYDVLEFSNWSGESGFLPMPPQTAYVARLSTSAADTGSSWVSLALEKRAVKKAALVIAHSTAMANKGELLYGCPAERTRVIPLGLPDRPPTATPSKNEIHLLSVGRAEDRKGTDLLISALVNVLPVFPNVVFRFVGPGLSEYLDKHQELQMKWERLRNSGRAFDMGRVSDAERDRLIASSHWLVTPSRFESFGLVAVEAMRAGTPVLYSEAGGLCDVAGASPHNVAVRPDDATDLERRLRDICERGPHAALSLRSMVRDTYLTQFQEQTMIQRTLEAYHEVLSRRGGFSG